MNLVQNVIDEARIHVRYRERTESGIDVSLLQAAALPQRRSGPFLTLLLKPFLGERLERDALYSRCAGPLGPSLPNRIDSLPCEFKRRLGFV
jgi:hypothetical protein